SISSGEANASKSAMASSTPGSQSTMILLLAMPRSPFPGGSDKRATRLRWPFSWFMRRAPPRLFQQFVGVVFRGGKYFLDLVGVLQRLGDRQPVLVFLHHVAGVALHQGGGQLPAGKVVADASAFRISLGEHLGGFVRMVDGPLGRLDGGAHPFLGDITMLGQIGGGGGIGPDRNVGRAGCGTDEAGRILLQGLLNLRNQIVLGVGGDVDHAREVDFVVWV